MQFISAIRPTPVETGPSFWFLFRDNQILIEIKENSHRIPFAEKAALGIEVETEQYLGTLDGSSCYAAHLVPETNLPETMVWFRPRELYGKLAEDLFWLAGRASQIINWDRTSRYCGSCGTVTKRMVDERGKICPECRQMNFPRISPAIIVAIMKENQILLAHNRNHPTNLYTVIAGFVEPGESLEECLKREVKEEVGIEVKNIRYFGSQPWPFPDSLMIAFTAEYAGGEIAVDGAEILDAGWFSASNLPEIPQKLSIARKLIDWFGDNYQ